jgi:hypothetical protein
VNKKREKDERSFAAPATSHFSLSLTLPHPGGSAKPFSLQNREKLQKHAARPFNVSPALATPAERPIILLLKGDSPRIAFGTRV